MANNPFRVRNTYLGVDNQAENTEPNQFMQYTQNNYDYQADSLEHTKNTFESGFKNSGNNLRSSGYPEGVSSVSTLKLITLST